MKDQKIVPLMIDFKFEEVTQNWKIQDETNYDLAYLFGAQEVMVTVKKDNEDTIMTFPTMMIKEFNSLEDIKKQEYDDLRDKQ